MKRTNGHYTYNENVCASDIILYYYYDNYPADGLNRIRPTAAGQTNCDFFAHTFVTSSSSLSS